MSKGAIVFSNDNERFTPKEFVDSFGSFDYDPATTKEKASELGIPHYDTIETDGLKADWTPYKRIWINPPFTIKHLFFKKACETYQKTGADIFFLCPIEFLTTKRFHDAVLGLDFTIYLPNGRIKFASGTGGAEKSPAFGSVVIHLGGFYRSVKLIDRNGIRRELS